MFFKILFSIFWGLSQFILTNKDVVECSLVKIKIVYQHTKCQCLGRSCSLSNHFMTVTVFWVSSKCSNTSRNGVIQRETTRTSLQRPPLHKGHFVFPADTFTLVLYLQWLPISTSSRSGDEWRVVSKETVVLLWWGSKNTKTSRLDSIGG